MLICGKLGCPCVHHRLLDCMEKGENNEAKSILRDLENFTELADSYGWSLLHYSAKFDNAVMAQHLIDAGINVDTQDKVGGTPLRVAVMYENVSTVELLLNNNADIYVSDEEGMNALRSVVCARLSSLLHMSLEQKSHVILELFIDKVNKDFLTRRDETMQILSKAVRQVKLAIVAMGSIEVAKFLLENGYIIHDPDISRGLSALQWALIFAKAKNARLLTEDPANIVHAMDNFSYYYTENFLPVDDETTILKIWLKYTFKSNYYKKNEVKSEFEYLLKRGDKRVVNAMVESEFDVVRMRFGYGNSFFNLLIRNRNADVLDVIEENDIKLDVNTVNSIAETVLFLALWDGTTRKLEFLLQRGADVRLLWTKWKRHFYDDTDSSAGNQIKPEKEIYYARVAQLLLQTGAEIEVVSRDRVSIIDIIRRCKKGFVTKVFLAHLAMLEAVNRSKLTTGTRSSIESQESIKTQFESYAKQLAEMKNCKLHGTVTLFELLTTKDEGRLAIYARNSELVSAFNETVKKMSHLESYYIDTLEKRFAKALSKVELERKAAAAIEQLTGLCSVTHYAIICYIISYLSTKDLNNLCNV